MSNVPSLRRATELIQIEGALSDLCALGQINFGYRHTPVYKAKMKDLRDTYLKVKRSPDLAEETTGGSI